jgi:hypothetical protein
MPCLRRALALVNDVRAEMALMEAQGGPPATRSKANAAVTGMHC